jgi:ribosomal protein S18 acetylase RimI-like enzyme
MGATTARTVTATIRALSPERAVRQGRWIAEMQPWMGMGFSAAALGRFLGRAARAGEVLVAETDADTDTDTGAGAGTHRPIAGVLVLQPNVLLGSFVALLAVRPRAAGRGVGSLLVAEAEARTFAARRWLYVSADADNLPALRFYRKLGFRRVAVLPDMVRAGRKEILLRKASPVPPARRRPTERRPSTRGS